MKTCLGIINVAVTVLAILALIAGCTSMSDGRYRYDQGWRPGDILQIGPGTTAFRSAEVDCRREKPGAASLERNYAYVHLTNGHEGGKYFNSNSKLRHVIVRIPDGAWFREGDHVHVNIRDCSQPVMR